TFIYDGEVVTPPTVIDVYWFDRGQSIQNQAAEAITKHFGGNRDCLDVVFHALKENCYYENGKHF
ncbi:MAG: DUF1904 family protein, partial [Bacilli bacterium]